MKKGKLIAADVAEIAIFVALMVAGAWVSIPFYPMPLTFQTVIAVLSGLLLGWKKGTIAMFAYLFMGFVCFIPVFSDHSVAGFAYALKPSFGYIIGFIGAAFTGGIIEGSGERTYRRYIAAGIAAFLVNYAIGVPYFALCWKYLFGGKMLGAAIFSYNIVYLPKDLVLSVLAGVLAKRTVPAITKLTMRRNRR